MRAYLIPSALIASLGLNAAQLINAGVPEVQAKSVEQLERVDYCLNAGNVTKLADIINSDLCGAVEAQLGLSEGTCTASKVMARLVGNMDFYPKAECGSGYGGGAQLRLPGSLVVEMP